VCHGWGAPRRRRADEDVRPYELLVDREYPVGARSTAY